MFQIVYAELCSIGLNVRLSSVERFDVITIRNDSRCIFDSIGCIGTIDMNGIVTITIHTTHT